MKQLLPHFHARLIIGLLFFCFSSIPLFAQPGQLDLSFNASDNGLGAGSGIPTAVTVSAVQPDGKIVVGGFFTTVEGRPANRIARLNADGSFDQTFNAGIGAPNSYVETIAVQSDGKILVGGPFTDFGGTGRNYLVRLNSDGSIDAGFNIGTGPNDTVRAIALQSDGKIIIGGQFSSFNGTPTSRLIRLNTNGTLDATFNAGGVGVTVSAVICMAVLPDDKIYIGGGFALYNDVLRPRIARLNADGTLDATFDAGAGTTNLVLTIKPRADGKVYVGGTFTTIAGQSVNRIVLLNNNGSRDASFNPNGGANQPVWRIDLQSDGKVLVGGDFTTIAGSNKSGVARLNADGSFDASFAGTGAAGAVYALNALPTGKTLLGGNFVFYNGALTLCFTRANSDGSVDTDFFKGGGFNFDVLSTTIQPDGKIIAGGRFGKYFNEYQFGIIRLNADGSKDNTFNVGTGTNNTVLTVARQSDGKIIAGGAFTFFNGAPINRLLRLNIDGSLDNTFTVGAGASGNVNTVVVAPDGKLLIGGVFAQYSGTNISRLARLNANGTLDNTFNTGTGADAGSVLGIAIQSDGKILAGGNFLNFNGVARRGLVRLNPNGDVDLTFNIGTGVSDATSVRSVIVLPDGKLIVQGSFVSFNSSTSAGIVRLNADGSLDNTFNVGTGVSGGSAFRVARLPDGKLLLAGDFTSFNGTACGGIIRLNPDGSIDNTFNSGTGATGVLPTINTISVQPTDGNIIIGGNFTSYNGVGRNRIARIFGGNYITTGAIAATCPDSTVQIPFTLTGTVNPGNVFTAQLSDASGSFASPVNIGTLAGTNSGSITATIPGGTTPGTGYKLRVTASNPVLTGSESAITISDCTVEETDIAVISLSLASACPDSTLAVNFTVSGPVNSGNVFTAQLSNASGSFASPVNIGTLSGTASGTITATIPGSTTPGTGYQIRVVSSNPVETSSNSLPLTVRDDCIPTFIRDIKSFEAAILPNPNNGNFNLRAAAPEAGNYNIQILDLSGRLISNQLIYLEVGQQVLPLQINEKGMFIISMQNELHQAVLKVMVH